MATSTASRPGRPRIWTVGLATAAALAALVAAHEPLNAAIGHAATHVLTVLVASAVAVLAAHWSLRRRFERRSQLAEASLREVAEHSRLIARAPAEQMRAIVATATEGIVTIDEAGNIDIWNAAAERLFGFTAAEVRGQNVSILMPTHYAAEHDGYIRRYLATGQARIIGIGREVVGRRKDGSYFPIDLSVGEGRLGEQRFFVAIIRDITERIAIQAKLSQAERLAAIGELAAGVAHEVNNPINTIINCAQLIVDGDDARANAAVVIEEGERIADIIKDLLGHARDDRDQTQATSVQDVVARTARVVGDSFRRHGIALAVAVPDDLPPVRARPQQLQQVLVNLLLNAKDALLQEPGAADRRVQVRASSDGETVALQVTDNGPGIPPELGDRIFEPFVTTKRGKGGTGLGLSISRSIVEGYGGTIAVRSAPGRGAEFCVRLPRCQEHAE